MPDDALLRPLTAILLGLPFGGALVLAAINRCIASGLAVAITMVGLLASILLAVNLPEQPTTYQTAWSTFFNLSFNVSFRLDGFTALMLVLVHFVALLVQLFS